MRGRVMPTMSAGMLALNAGLVDSLVRESFAQRAGSAAPAAEAPTMPHGWTEGELQRAAESLLELMQYRRLSADCVERNWGPEMRGFFGHLSNPERNPLMPDLFIFDRSLCRPPLLIELKVRDEYQPGQRVLIECGFWQEARSVDAVRALVLAWERGDDGGAAA